MTDHPACEVTSELNAVGRDVTNRADIEVIVNDFYKISWTDPVLKHIFAHVVPLDLPNHIPVVVDFWDSVIFRTGSYSRGAFGPHIDVHKKITLGHDEFSRWLSAWERAVTQSFAGPIATRMVRQAEQFAASFERRLSEITTSPGSDEEPLSKSNRIHVQFSRRTPD